MNLELYELIKNLSTWEGALADITPLLDFLNMERKAICQYENDAINLSSDDLSIADILNLRHELEQVLTDMLSLPARHRQGICDFLSDQLKKPRNEVVFRSRHSRQIRVNMVCDDIVSNIWGDMICIFLSQGYWDDVLGHCPQCKIWFRRGRKDQIYCGDNCRSKASYYKHQGKRQESGRLRYSKRGLTRR